MFKKTGVLLTLLVVCATVVVYAESPIEELRNEAKNLRSEMKQQMQDGESNTKDAASANREQIREYREVFYKENGRLADYLADDLSDEEKYEVRDLLHEKDADIKQVLKEFVSSPIEAESEEADLAQVIAELESIVVQYHDAIEEYVEADLTAEYDEFVDAWIANYMESTEMRLQNLLDRKAERQILRKQRKHDLAPKIKLLMTRRLDNISVERQDDILADFLEKIGAKIDQVKANEDLSHDNKERLQSWLQELYDMTLDAMDTYLVVEDIEGEIE